MNGCPSERDRCVEFGHGAMSSFHVDEQICFAFAKCVGKPVLNRITKRTIARFLCTWTVDDEPAQLLKCSKFVVGYSALHLHLPFLSRVFFFSVELYRGKGYLVMYKVISMVLLS